MNMIGWLAGGGSAPLAIRMIAQRTSLGTALALASLAYLAAGGVLVAGMIAFVTRDAARMQDGI